MPNSRGDLQRGGAPDGAPISGAAINDTFGYRYTPAQRKAFVELFFAYWDRVYEGLAKRGVTLTRDDHLILQAVFIVNSENRPSTVREIGERTRIARSTVHRRIDELAHSGFVVAHAQPKQRELEVWLSEDLALDGAMFADLALHDFMVTMERIQANPEPDPQKRKYAPFGPPGSQVLRQVRSRARP